MLESTGPLLIVFLLVLRFRSKLSGSGVWRNHALNLAIASYSTNSNGIIKTPSLHPLKRFAG